MSCPALLCSALLYSTQLSCANALLYKDTLFTKFFSYSLLSLFSALYHSLDILDMCYILLHIEVYLAYSATTCSALSSMLSRPVFARRRLHTCRISGAMYSGDPHSVSAKPCGCSARAKPKSPIFSTAPAPGLLSNRFCGFKSLCAQSQTL